MSIFSKTHADGPLKVGYMSGGVEADLELGKPGTGGKGARVKYGGYTGSSIGARAIKGCQKRQAEPSQTEGPSVAHPILSRSLDSTLPGACGPQPSTKASSSSSSILLHKQAAVYNLSSCS